MILHLLSTGHYISPHFFRFSFICCIILQLSVSCASLVFIPRTSTLNTLCNNWCWSWSPNTLSTWCELPTHWKRPWCWKWLKAEEEEGNRGWDGWMASPTQWTWTWANSGRWWRTGWWRLECCSPWGGKELVTTWWLNKNFRWHAKCHCMYSNFLKLPFPIAGC